MCFSIESMHTPSYIDVVPNLSCNLEHLQGVATRLSLYNVFSSGLHTWGVFGTKENVFHEQRFPRKCLLGKQVLFSSVC